jgi:hypothetical protein
VNSGGRAKRSLLPYRLSTPACGGLTAKPLWQAWIQERFPMPTEPGKSERAFGDGGAFPSLRARCLVSSPAFAGGLAVRWPKTKRWTAILTRSTTG